MPRRENDDVSLIVRLPRADRSDLSRLRSLPVAGRGGQVVSVGELVRFEPSRGEQQHLSQEPDAGGVRDR